MNNVSATTIRGKGAPPLPPTKRPAGKKPAPPPSPRDSGYAGGGGPGASAGGRLTAPKTDARNSGGSIAGGLAEALRQRQAAMQPRQDDSW